MTRTQRFLGGFVSGYAHLVVATLAGLWLTPFFLSHLGQSTYGLWLVGTQVISYLLLLDLGIVALLPRETAYVTGRTGGAQSAELRQVVEQALTLAVGQTPFVLAAAVLALLWLPESWAALRAPLAVALGLFVVTFPLRVFQAALTGLQDLAFVARAQFAAWTAGILVNIWLRGCGISAHGARRRLVRDAAADDRRVHRAGGNEVSRRRCRTGSRFANRCRRATTSSVPPGCRSRRCPRCC